MGQEIRRPGLDLLRAVAIVWVMCFHTFLIGGVNEHFSAVQHFGWMGVDLFFVLSGFLIGSQVLSPLARGEPLAFRDFYVRRAFRILPAFAVVLALYLIFPAFREAPGLESWWKFPTFTLNLLIDYDRNPAFSHAWSLCIEEHFYLVFPLAAWALAARMTLTGFFLLILTLILAGIGLRTAIWFHDQAVDPHRNWFVEDLYFPTWSRLDGLLAGVTLAAVKTFRRCLWERWAKHADLTLLAGLALLVVSFRLCAVRNGLPAISMGFPVLSLAFALLVFAGAQASGTLGALVPPGADWLAAVSYSLYLVHKAVYHLVWVRFGDALTGHGLLALASYGGAALAGAALVHYLVERPCLQMRTRWRGQSFPGSNHLLVPIPVAADDHVVEGNREIDESRQ